MTKNSKKDSIISAVLITIGIMLFTLISIFLIKSIVYDFLSRLTDEKRSHYVLYVLVVPSISAILISVGLFLLLRKIEKLKNSKVANVITLIIMICGILPFTWFYFFAFMGVTSFNYSETTNAVVDENAKMRNNPYLINFFIDHHLILFCGTFYYVTSIFWISVTSVNINRINNLKQITTK
ncbi:hypothetical protein DA803_00135 [[Mycoplasma] phocae]|uniref:Uncharacterized protein n=1 Tax=[Mycoplasma] phocae TaxID=142651 RepID=A0A2Z5IPI8_9BACT|nr:hypothetical protein [[Mycoplasma] phocae]AXE60510.1 hypothetical protein DA803_00135 [[Mycoplasma] phocae]